MSILKVSISTSPLESAPEVVSKAVSCPKSMKKTLCNDIARRIENELKRAMPEGYLYFVPLWVTICYPNGDVHCHKLPLYC